MSNPLGSTIGTYSVLRQLDAGGMGSVFEAEDTKLKRRVALKMLPERLAQNPDHLSRFRREAQVLAALNHPNIVTIYSVEEDPEGRPFLTMEWVSGQTLSELIPPGGLPLDRFFELVLPLTDALHAAHQRDVVHRDLKPANIMVTDDGRLKILDFGLAKKQVDESDQETREPVTREGQMLGTLPYMSPEQLQGGPIDHRTDIFSTGIILQEMLTGERPFEGTSWGDLASAILRDDPPSVSQLRPTLPRHLGRILKHCLEKDSQRRFQTALDLRNELEELKREIETGELEATRSGFSAILQRQPRRRPWLLVIVGLALSGSLATASWFYNPRQQASTAVDDTTDRHQPKRIIVLPFENLGPPDEAYFAAGVTDEITSRLARVSSLRVISRKTAGDDEALDADYLLEGSVRWDSRSEVRRARVTPRLVRVSDGTHMWSESYERVIDDLFAVQSQIASEVIRQMDVVLLEPERRALHDRPTDNMEAFEAYLRGMDLAGRRTPSIDNWQEAVEMFERATELDPGFALASAELSEVHSLVFHLRLDRNEDRLARARQAADRALTLDPQLPQGHRALGYYYYWGHEDYESALASFAQAAEGLPTDSQVLAGSAYVWRRQGKFDQAARRLRQALDHEPESSWLAAEVADTYRSMRRYREADRHYARAIDLAAGQETIYHGRVLNEYLWRGDTAAARSILDSMPRKESSGTALARYTLELYDGNFAGALEALGQTPTNLFGLDGGSFPRSYLKGMVYAASGDSAEAAIHFATALRTLEVNLKKRPESARLITVMAMAHAFLGHSEVALGLAQRAALSEPPESDAIIGSKMQENLAVVHAWNGNHDAAIEILQSLLAAPSELSPQILRLDPKWLPLAEHNEFRALLTAADQS